MARVLVVDDDAGGLEIRKLVLEREGHQVTIATDSEAARSAFRSMEPETVVMDVRLPLAEDGLRLIREFRGDRPSVRIVILSGSSADLDRREEAGMVDEILTKPVRSEILVRAVESSLGQAGS